MAEVGESLARELNEKGFKPGAVVRHKRTGEEITVGRIFRGKVYITNDGTGRKGRTQHYDVVKPNHVCAPDYWGKVDNCGRPSRRWF